MFRRFPFSAFFFAFLLCGASAQQTVVLGNATAALNGPWKFHPGDDLAWARPDFDDSAWASLDLTESPDLRDPNLGTPGWVPGWTARGYKGLSGYAWYRLRVHIQNGQGALALKMPANVDDAYQVFVDGQRIGEFGRFTAHGVTFYPTQPRAFPMPEVSPGHEATIAIRMWMSPDTPFSQVGAGGMHEPPVLGQASIVQSLNDLLWFRVDQSSAISWLAVLVTFVALLVAFSLFWLDRSEMAYLWLGIQCTQGLLFTALSLISAYTTWISGNTVNLLLGAVLGPLGNGLVVIFWATWFRTSLGGRLQRIV